MRAAAVACLWACYSLLLASVANAQALDPRKSLSQYVLDRWQQEEGLPQNTVHSLHQSRDGYLWAGTYQGLARFDGIRFKVFNMSNTPELRSNGIWTIAEDHRGALWLGTNGGGLTELHQGRFRTFDVEHGLEQAMVRSILRDQDKSLWLAYPMGLSRLSVPPDTAKRIRPEPVMGMEKQNVLALVQDRAGTVWVGSREGLYRVVQRDSGWVALRHTGILGRTVYALCPDPDGSLWIGTDAGLFRLDQNVIQRLDQVQGLSEPRVARIYKDRSGTLWVVTVAGELNRLAEGRFTHLSIRDDFQDNRIFAILEDREGSLWFGTSRSGLHRLKESKVVSYGRPEGMNAEVTYAVLQGPDGSMYFGTNGGGVNRLMGTGRDERFRVYDRKSGLGNSYARTLAFDMQGRLWVGSYGSGVDVLDVNSGRVLRRYTPREGLLDEFVRVIKPMPDGCIWLGTRKGINRIQDGRVVGSYGTEHGLGVAGVLCIESAGQDKLFVGTDGGGVSTFNAGRFVNLTINDGLPSNVVLSLMWDRRDQTLWIGTNNGLALLRKGKLTSFLEAELKMPESVLQLLDDETGMLWMGSTNGLFAVPKAALYAYADSQMTSLDVRQYGRADGLRSIECTPNGHPSAVRSSDGRLWFPTSRGLAVVDPWQIPLNRQVPNVVVEAASIGDATRDLQEQQELLIEPGTLRFELHYTALSFMVPGKVRFRYRLEGYDEDWIEAGARRVAYYTNLPAGGYKFHVQACNNDGLWNDMGAVQAIRVLPHLYQTWWFLALMGLMVVGIGGVLYRLRVRVLQRQNEVLEAMVESRTAELRNQSDQLKQQTQALTLSNTNLSVLTEIGQEITATLNARELYDLLDRSLHRLMDYDVFTVHEYRPDRHQLERSYAVEQGNLQPVSMKSMDDTTSLAVWSVKNRRSAQLRDYDNEYSQYVTMPRQFTRSKMRSVMVAPLMVKEKVLGCVGVQSSRLDAFRDWQFDMLQTIASYAGIALDNAKAYDTINRVNHEIGEQNQRLGKALEELKSAQEQLVMSEKMAALGQLVASVAHEINTPISAITSATRNSERMLPEVVNELPELLGQLNPEESEILHALIDRSARAPEFTSTRAERQSRQAMRAELEAAGVEHAEALASRLAQMRIEPPLTELLPLLRHAQAEALLNTATKLSALQQNTRLVLRAAEKTTKIVSALRAYTHSKRGEERLPMNLSESIEGILTLYANQFRQGVKLVREFDTLPPVPVYADEIEQVWSNLTHNALLAMRDGGSLTIRTQHSGTQAIVSFIDTGVGIPPEVLPRIFDPFFTTRPKGEGSGLGLDIVRKIVRKHGGEVEVESVPGHTQFRVLLPLLPQSHSA